MNIIDSSVEYVPENAEEVKKVGQAAASLKALQMKESIFIFEKFITINAKFYLLLCKY